MAQRRLSPPARAPDAGGRCHEPGHANPGTRGADDFGEDRARRLRHLAVPLSGQPPGQDKPFFDVEKDGRRGHTSPRGGIYWEDTTYSDRRVLLYIPRGFDAALPAVMIVYFHGNVATLERVVHRQQQVPRQLAESGLNAVLVAPQLAVNAADSSAGRFYDAGQFRRFVEEAGVRLARLHGDQRARAAIESLPVIVVAYSGGYAPAAWAAHHGGSATGCAASSCSTRSTPRWTSSRPGSSGASSAFFFSAFSRSARDENLVLQRMLAERRIDFATSLPSQAGARQRDLPRHRRGRRCTASSSPRPGSTIPCARCWPGSPATPARRPPRPASADATVQLIRERRPSC